MLHVYSTNTCYCFVLLIFILCFCLKTWLVIKRHIRLCNGCKWHRQKPRLTGGDLKAIQEGLRLRVKPSFLLWWSILNNRVSPNRLLVTFHKRRWRPCKSCGSTAWGLAHITNLVVKLRGKGSGDICVGYMQSHDEGMNILS